MRQDLQSSHIWSFRSSENGSFKNFVDYLRADVRISGRTKFSEMIKKRADLMKKHVLVDLDSVIKVSLALDTWTSSNHLAFMSVTDYFIDEEWRYRKVLHAFQPLTDSHTDNNLTTEILNIILEYQIEKRLHAITADNASFNDILIRLPTAGGKSLAIMLSAYLNRNLVNLVFVPYKALREDLRHRLTEKGIQSRVYSQDCKFVMQSQQLFFVLQRPHSRILSTLILQN